MGGPNLVTAPDEQQLCCVLDDTGARCLNPSRYWVGTQGIDDYTYVCADHLDAVRREEDTVVDLVAEQGSAVTTPGEK